MKAWKKRLVAIFITSGLSAYAHNIVWAWCSEAGLGYWANWAERAAVTSLVVACVSGFAVFVAFAGDASDESTR